MLFSQVDRFWAPLDRAALSHKFLLARVFEN